MPKHDWKRCTIPQCDLCREHRRVKTQKKYLEDEDLVLANNRAELYKRPHRITPSLMAAIEAVDGPAPDVDLCVAGAETRDQLEDQNELSFYYAAQGFSTVADVEAEELQANFVVSEPSDDEVGSDSDLEPEAQMSLDSDSE